MTTSTIVAVTSGKGGTGKSTFSINLAIAAAKEAAPVLLIDMDAGMRCLDLLLSVSESVVMDVSDVVNGADLSSSVIPVGKFSGLYLLPAPSSIGLVNPEKFSRFINKIRDDYSLIIIDFPAGSDYTLYKELPRDTRFVCICTPDPVSVRDASLCGKAIRAMDRHGWLVINKYAYEYIENHFFKNIDDIINETGLQLLGIVPLSYKFYCAFNTGAFPKRGKEAKAFSRIYKRINGKSIPLPKLKKI
ncbi:MAG: P-loop NTPase [Clostridia bacterium]|nr:P-loop NTPase [Clostridia bacterium]